MNLCPQCGGTIPPQAPEGLCPQCLLKLGLLGNVGEVETEGEADAPSSDDDNPPAFGEQFGPYKTIRLLGEGGMGTVYLAEQQKPIRRLVALKVIKLGMNTRNVLARFDSERQALALMDHPNIARVFDAGMSDCGQPYFVMEYVSGVPITDYCDQNLLTNRERIEVFIEVCRAVQHAHQKGVIHRDIKPSNVLIGQLDGKPFPQVIDFGIAKATDKCLVECTAFTELGQLVGTPEYMSPEQANLGDLNIDTRTDVYSLGVLLYELLVGVLPFEKKYLREAGLAELLRIIREEEPLVPSSRLDALKDTAQEIAHHHRTELATMRRQLANDLNWIVMKALEKDKERRYSSASDLADDIRRYLTDQPVTARPPSAGYYLLKFTRRHTGVMASAAAVFIVLLVGLIASTWEAVRANRAEAAALLDRDRATAAEKRATQQSVRASLAERVAYADRNRAVAAETQAIQQRNRALQAEKEAINERNKETLAEQKAIAAQQRSATESATTGAINEFLQNILAQAGADAQARPSTNPDPDLKVRTVLDRAAERLNTRFKGRPLVEASIRQTIGNAYRQLGLYDDAQRHRQIAFDLRKALLGEEDPETLAVMDEIAHTLYRFQRQYKPAEVMLAKILEVRRHNLGDDQVATLETMNELGDLYRFEGKLAQAQLLFTTALAGLRRVFGENGFATLETMNNLALLYVRQDKKPEAESLFLQAFHGFRALLGEEHPETLITENNLADLYRSEGRFGQAEPLYTKVLETRRRVLGEDHSETLSTMVDLASLYKLQGSKYAEAEPLLIKVLEARSRQLGEENPETLNTMNRLADVYRFQGRFGEAQELFTKALEGLGRVVGEENVVTLDTLNNLALLYQGQGKQSEAEALLLKALDGLRRLLGEDNPETLFVANNLAGLYLDQGRYTEAEPLYTKVLERRRRVLGEDHPGTGRTMSSLAMMYQQQGRYIEAEPLLSKLVEISRRNYGLSDPTAIALNSLGVLRLRENRYVEAEALLRQSLGIFEKADPNNWLRYNAETRLGESLAGQRRYQDAEPLFLSGYQGMILQRDRVARSANGRLRMKEAGESIVRLYETWDKPDKASEWRQKLKTAADALLLTQP